jgi:hypothetical protein
MNVVDNLNSVEVINKPCMSSRNMCLLPRAALHSDSEHKLLGIHLYEHLSFDHYVKLLCNKLNRSLFCINRAKNFLTPKHYQNFTYYALIHSHLTYFPIIGGCAQQHNIEKITNIQKKAIRTITSKRARGHTEPLFNRLKILTYEKIIAQANQNFLHAVHHNNAP